MTIDTDSLKTDVKFFAVGFGISGALLLIIQSVMWRVLLSLPMALFLARLIFDGATIIAVQLRGVKRTTFQIAVTVLVPLLLSLYFFPMPFHGSISQLWDGVTTTWILIPAGIISYVTWVGAEQLDKEFPFRGFLITSGVIFIFCFLGHNGIFTETSDDGETRTAYIDKEHAKGALMSGRYFGLYVTYVTIAFITMYMRFRRQLERDRKWERRSLR